MTENLPGTGFADDGRLIIPASLALASEDGHEQYAAPPEGADAPVRDERRHSNAIPRLPLRLTPRRRCGYWHGCCQQTYRADAPRYRDPRCPRALVTPATPRAAETTAPRTQAL